jgi:hypothetical protein
MVLLSFLLMPCIIAGAGFHDSAGVIAVRDVAGSLMLRVFPDVASVPVAASVSAVAVDLAFAQVQALLHSRRHASQTYAVRNQAHTNTHHFFTPASTHNCKLHTPNVPIIPHWPLPAVTDLTRDGRWITYDVGVYSRCPMFHSAEKAHAWETL